MYVRILCEYITMQNNEPNVYKITDKTLIKNIKTLGEVEALSEAYEFVKELIISGKNVFYPEHSEILAFDIDEENDAADMAVTDGYDIKLITVEKF
mgnify:CR=1 FL=1